MSTTRRIAKNTSVFFLANIINYIFLFFTTMYTARYLGPGGYGILSIALAFSGMFGVLADLGLGLLTTREIAKDRFLTSKYVGNTIIIRLILALLTVGIIILIANLGAYLGKYTQETINIIYILSLPIIIGVFPGIFTSVFQAYEKMEYPSINLILSGVIFLGGTLYLISDEFGVLAFALLNVFVSVVSLVCSILIYSWKLSLPKIKIDLDFWKYSIKEALPFGLTNISGMIYTYLDSIILSALQPTEVVGWYSAAYKLMLILLFIPNAVNVAIFPVMSRVYVCSKESLKLMYERYFKLMIIIGLPIGIGTTLLAEKIILLIFGPNYLNSVIALQILIWTMVLSFAGASFVQLLQATNKQLIITKISGICVIVNIMLNLVLIPKFSYVGASFATLITEIILVGYIFLATYKIGYGIPYKLVIKDLSKVLFATLIMSIFVWYFKSLNLFLLIIMATLFYFISLYIVRGIDKVDIMLLKQLW